MKSLFIKLILLSLLSIHLSISASSDLPRNYEEKIPMYFLTGYGSTQYPVMFTGRDNRQYQFSSTYKNELIKYRHVNRQEVDDILDQFYVRLGSWNTLSGGPQDTNLSDTDGEARREIEDELVHNSENNRLVVLMGHSYGGDTALLLARCLGGVDADCKTGNMKRANDNPWTVLYLGLIDPVKSGGRRASRTPTENVIHFDNFMSPEPSLGKAIPYNYRSSGNLDRSLAGSSWQSQLTYIGDWSGYPVRESTHQKLVDPRSKYISVLIFDSLQRILSKDSVIERPKGSWKSSSIKSDYVYAGKVPGGSLTVAVCRDKDTGTPGKLIVEWNKCYIPHLGREDVRIGHQYEVLHNDGTYKWEQYNSVLPKNAVKAEVIHYDEEQYFCKVNGSNNVGKYLVSTATCYVGISGREDLHFKDFQILTKGNGAGSETNGPTLTQGFCTIKATYSLTRNCQNGGSYVGPYAANKHGGFCLESIGDCSVTSEIVQYKNCFGDAVYIGPNAVSKHWGTCANVSGGYKFETRYTLSKNCNTNEIYLGANAANQHGGHCVSLNTSSN
ncbi:DM9 repeat-containing protein [Pleionea sediminis]|uniref:DM9 repeat-containing protein n=1 Tax=Pleionea sediminis TaxID=2569479 RepID=UPI0011853A2F|nr:DM9 repeat-containing protein [Pleionea sediminis]